MEYTNTNSFLTPMNSKNNEPAPIYEYTQTENIQKELEDKNIYYIDSKAINNNDTYINYQTLTNEVKNLEQEKTKLLNELNTLKSTKNKLIGEINDLNIEKRRIIENINNKSLEEQQKLEVSKKLFEQEKMDFNKSKEFIISQYKQMYETYYQNYAKQLKNQYDNQIKSYISYLEKQYEERKKNFLSQINYAFQKDYQLNYNYNFNYENSNSYILQNNEIVENNEINNKPKGLYNLNFNCYINSLIQCFYYIKSLRNYFIDNKNKFNKEKPICEALSNILYNLKNGKESNYDASKFKQIMGEKNKLFEGFNGGDAKDLFFNLIDSILYELSTNDKNIKSSNVESGISEKMHAFKEAEEEVDKNIIINDVFIGFYEVIYKCSYHACNIYSFSYETFILFNLEKISQSFGNNELSLDNCFEYNFNRNYKTSFYCSKCKTNENNLSVEKIYKPPKILVLILDRGKGKKFKGKVNFTIDLDLLNYIDMDENDGEFSTKYKLISVLTHSGVSSASGGHYTACCLTDNGSYYYFSDTFVKEIQEEILFRNEPYLLFYGREGCI